MAARAQAVIWCAPFTKSSNCLCACSVKPSISVALAVFSSLFSSPISLSAAEEMCNTSVLIQSQVYWNREKPRTTAQERHTHNFHCNLRPPSLLAALIPHRNYQAVMSMARRNLQISWTSLFQFAQKIEGCWKCRGGGNTSASAVDSSATNRHQIELHFILIPAIKACHN